MDALSLQLGILAVLLANPDYHIRSSINLSTVPPLYLSVGQHVGSLESRLRCSQSLELQIDATIASIRPSNGEWPRLDVLHYIETDKYLLEKEVWPSEWALAFLDYDYSENTYIAPAAYQRATRAYVGHLVRSGQPRESIVRVLEAMVAKQEELGGLYFGGDCWP